MKSKRKSKKQDAKKKMTLKESKELDYLDFINVNEECINIVANPQKYFEKSLNASNKPFYIICVKFAIISKMREIDTVTSISDKTSLHFIQKYSMKKWIDILINFYEYYQSSMIYIIENYENTLLDLYNDKEIDFNVMIIGMTTFKETRNIINNDVELIKKCIEELEKDKDKFQNIG